MKNFFSASVLSSHFLFQEQNNKEVLSSSESVNPKEALLLKIEEKVNEIEAAFQNYTLDETGELQNQLVDVELHRLLSALDTPEDVRAAVQDLLDLGFRFDDIRTRDIPNDGLEFKNTQTETVVLKDHTETDYYQYLKNNKTRFISEKNPLRINGKVFTLKEISINDLQNIDRADIKTDSDLKLALDIAQSQGKVEGRLTDQQIKTLFWFMKVGIEYDANVKLMQDILVALDPSLKAKLKKNGKEDDGYYGFATSEAVQSLATLLSDYVQQKIELRVPTPKEHIERLFAGRDKIVLLLDITGSMTKQISALADYVDNEILKKSPKTEIFIRVFDENGLLGMSVPFRSDNRDEIFQRLKNMDTGGGGDTPEPIFNATSVLVSDLFPDLTSEELKQKEEGARNKNLVLVFSDAPSKPLNYKNSSIFKVDPEERQNMKNRIPLIQKKSIQTGTDVFFFSPNIEKNEARVASIDDVLKEYKDESVFNPTGMASAGIIQNFGKK